MAKKIVPIKYTSRNFETIKRDLVEHAKRYYPDSYKDFNEGSFGSLMFDTVSYVGDILSFYLDYQANECFLETASEFNNVLKIARQLGYKFINGSTSTGMATFYIAVPAISTTALSPDMRYAPILKAGSTFSTSDGSKFILLEDIRFDLSTDISTLLINNNTSPGIYGIRAYGKVISGITTSETITLGNYEKFLKVKLAQSSIAEIISVRDSEGNEYYEVPNLSQNIIYKSFTNENSETAKLAKEILVPYLAPRRFTVETEVGATYLQFGGSSNAYIPENMSMVAEPGRVVLETFGKQYISDTTFDPTRLLNTDKLGIAPSNTVLTVTYRYNPAGTNINFGVNSLINVLSPIFEFKDEQNLDATAVDGVRGSLELTNKSPILGEVTAINSSELKVRIQNTYSAQNRAVSAEDYKAIVYNMPYKFGSVKRVTVIRDDDSVKRNLNAYILCEDPDGHLTNSNQVVKNNLKTWLLNSKMLNDSIDILDGKIINYGIDFEITCQNNISKFTVLSNAINQLKKDFSKIYDFGETFYYNTIIESLLKVEGVSTVSMVNIVPKIGDPYSNSTFDFVNNTSIDGTYISVPLNAVMELKFPDSDIKGTIK